MGKQIRYLSVSLRTEGKLIALDEIIIGANQDGEEAREHLKSLLSTKGYIAGTIEYPRITISGVNPAP
jgi:hypothetical protein